MTPQHQLFWDAMQLKRLVSSDDAEVGRHTYGTPTFRRYPSGSKVKIGAFCSIADGVTFIQGGEHFMNCMTTSPLCLLIPGIPLTEWERDLGQITVGNDVWIGYGATILSGVSIGDGAVIGACSVVTRDVLPYEVVAGNPVRHLRFRFPRKLRAEYLANPWWELPDEDIAFVYSATNRRETL